MIKKNFIILALSVLLVLLLPFFAMQFTNEVHWSAVDFLLAGVLLFIFGLFLILITRLVKKNSYKWILVVGLVILLFLVWAEIAVGVFNTPFSGS